MKKGFTLLEMLVAIVVLTISIVAVLRIVSMGMFADVNTENAAVALYLAQEKMEEIKDAATYAAIDSFASARTTLGGAFTDFDRAVTVSGDPKQVTVTVYWKVKGQDQSRSFVTLFTDYDY